MRIIRPVKGRKRTYKMGYRPPFEMKSMKWKFHAYDDDPFPSVPHGHSVNSVHKLHVYSGEIYKGKNVWGIIKKKELERLWDDPRFVKYVEVAKQYHEQKQKEANITRRYGHKRRAPRRRNAFFTFTCEIEIYDSEE